MKQLDDVKLEMMISGIKLEILKMLSNWSIHVLFFRSSLNRSQLNQSHRVSVLSSSKW